MDVDEKVNSTSSGTLLVASAQTQNTEIHHAHLMPMAYRSFTAGCCLLAATTAESLMHAIYPPGCAFETRQGEVCECVLVSISQILRVLLHLQFSTISSQGWSVE